MVSSTLLNAYFAWLHQQDMTIFQNFLPDFQDFLNQEPEQILSTQLSIFHLLKPAQTYVQELLYDSV